MRIALFSDIHGNVAALEAVLADIEAEGVDANLCLGDIAAFGPRPVEVIERLRVVDDLMLIRGNTDRWLGIVKEDPDGPYDEPVIASVRHALQWTLDQVTDDAARSLTELPSTGALEAGGVRIVAEHASPGSDWKGISLQTNTSELESMFTGFDGHAFVCGHTHMPLVRPVAERVIIVNDGSVGLPYDGVQRPSWAILEVTEQGLRAGIRRVDYDRDAVLKDIADRSMAWGEVVTRRIEQARKS